MNAHKWTEKNLNNYLVFFDKSGPVSAASREECVRGEKNNAV